MQSFKDVWEKALVILQNDLNTTSYETWIKLLTPMKMENDVAYFCISTLFQKNIIDKKLASTIHACRSDERICSNRICIKFDNVNVFSSSCNKGFTASAFYRNLLVVRMNIAFHVSPRESCYINLPFDAVCYYIIV